MPEWYEIAAGLPDFTGAAGSWFDRMYGVRRQQTQDQAAKDAAALRAKEKENALLTKQLTQEDIRLRDTLSKRVAKDNPLGSGKYSNLDKYPWQAEHNAYNQEAATYKPPEPAFDALPELGQPSAEANIQRQVREIAPSDSRKAAIEARANLAAKLHGPEFADLIRRRDEAQLEPELAAQKQALETELRSQSYYAAHPERTVPVMAGKVREATATAQTEKEKQALKRTQTTAGVGYQRNAMDEANRQAAQAAQEAQQQKYAEKLDNLQQMRDLVSNMPEGQGMVGIPTLAELDGLIAQTKREGIAYASPPLPVKPEAQQAGWTKALVESQKAEQKKAGGAAKPPDLNKPIANLDKEIKALRDTFPQTEESQTALADAIARKKAITDKQNTELGIQPGPAKVAPPKAPAAPPKPRMFDRAVSGVSGLFSGGAAQPAAPLAVPSRMSTEGKQMIEWLAGKKNIPAPEAEKILLLDKKIR